MYRSTLGLRTTFVVFSALRRHVVTPCPQYDHQSDFCVYDDVSTVWKFHWFILAGFLQPPAWIPANFYRRDNRSLRYHTVVWKK